MRKVFIVIALVMVLLIPLGLKITGGHGPTGWHASRQKNSAVGVSIATRELNELASSWIDPVTGENRPRMVVISVDDDGQMSLAARSEGVKEIKTKVPDLTPTTAPRFLEAYAGRLAFDPVDTVVFVNGHPLAREDTDHLLALTGGLEAWAARFEPPVGGPDPRGGVTYLATVPLPRPDFR